MPEAVSPSAQNLAEPDHTSRDGHCDVLLVRARTLSISDWIGRLVMKVQVYHLPIPLLLPSCVLSGCGGHSSVLLCGDIRPYRMQIQRDQLVVTGVFDPFKVRVQTAFLPG
jgi:hypothetical protein